MGRVSTLVQALAGFPHDKHALPTAPARRCPAFVGCPVGTCVFHRQKKKKPRMTVGVHPASFGAFRLLRGGFQEAGFSPYQRGVYTHSPPPARPMSRPSTTGVSALRCCATISRARPSCHGRAREIGL